MTFTEKNSGHTNGRKEPMNAQQQSGKSAQQRFDESKKQPGETKYVKAFKNLSGEYVFNWFDAEHVLVKHIALKPEQMYVMIELFGDYFTGKDSIFKGIEWQ